MTEGIETTTGPLGQGFANGVGMAIAERFLAERYNRPAARARRAPGLRDLLRRRPDGGRDAWRPRRSPATSASGASSTSTTTTTSRSTARPRSRTRPRTRASASRRTAGTSSTSTTRRTSTRSSRRSRRRRPRRSGPRCRSSGATSRTRRSEGDGHREGARLPARRGRGRGDEGGARLGSRRTVPRPGRGRRSTWPGTSVSRGSPPSRSGTRRFERWSTAFPGLREEWDADRLGKPRPGWLEALPSFQAGEEMATRDAGKQVMQAVKPYAPTMIGGAADLVESTKTEFEGGGLFSADARRAQHRLRHPRARDGLDRERDRARRGDAEAVRLDLPDLLRLHAPGRAALGADGHSSRSGSGRTTRSASARTGRPTSRSSTTWRCARSRTSGTCAPATRTRRRWPGGSRSSARAGPWRSR